MLPAALLIRAAFRSASGSSGEASRNADCRNSLTRRDAWGGLMGKGVALRGGGSPFASALRLDDDALKMLRDLRFHLFKLRFFHRSSFGPLDEVVYI